MSNDTSDSTELPIFPTAAPAVFCDPDATTALFTDALRRLARVIDIDDEQLDLPTPCEDYTAGQLQTHVLGWLDFFATALTDPGATSTRPNPDEFVLTNDMSASDFVQSSLSRIHQAIADDVAGQLVVMSGSRMAGDGVLAMALGEYTIHAWDLATATGHDYQASRAVIEPAHEFLQGMVAPEYRGPDSGFFDHEVAVPADASPLHKLLAFAGRTP